VSSDGAPRSPGVARGSRTSDYDYDLPPARIARFPAPLRDEARLLVVGQQRFTHRVFRDLLDLFRAGDVLVLNDTRVFPARLVGFKPTGARAEILLIRPRGEESGDRQTGYTQPWEALVRPGGKLKPGRVVDIAEGFRGQIVDSVEGGGRLVELRSTRPVAESLALHGHVPLPPYIDREDEPVDRERYQTVYARESGSVAAPTAGLHFTRELLDEATVRGVSIARTLLHVGIGTFRPVEEDDPGAHPMHREVYRVEPEEAERINAARSAGGRVWAVGTTVVRTLETVTGEDGRVRPGQGETDLFIRPPYRFRAVDGLITNFHLPRSTLLMLVAAFAGYERTMDAYGVAVEEGYRFYSYGDSMVIPPSSD
jgi:S-adenosylmethionine:tRNA ribosyltransferase-isomerase